MKRTWFRKAILAVAPMILAASCGAPVTHGDPTSTSKQRLSAPSAASYKPVCPLVGPGLARCHSQIVTDAQSNVVVNVAPSGFGPPDLLSAYNVPTGGGAGQTIGIVDAYDNPFAEQDLATYRAQYGLPPCTSASGCFTKVNEQGLSTPPSQVDFGWAVESSLDIEMASAICPNCNILLVEATSQALSDLGMSVDTAVTLGATVVSNSYGFPDDPSYVANDALYFNHPGVFITASSGDSGFGAAYPATSQYTTAVGGTTLTEDPTSPRGWSETAWSGSGSGCSQYFAKPSWQTDTGCTMRMEADMSAVADPFTGVAVYSSFEGGWTILGGTSVASPLVASLFALSSRNTVNASFIWQNTQDFYDVTSGSNGTCSVPYECTAGPGYDGPTGWGTPDGALIDTPIRVATSAEACAGQGATTTITVFGGESIGFDGDVSLSLTAVSPTPPAGGEISATFSPNPVPAPTASGATASMQTTTTSATPAGTYTLTVQGTSTSVTQSTTMTLVVRDGPPGAVTLQTPASGAEGVAFTPTFTWTAGTEDTSYTLDILPSSDCSGTPLHSYPVTGTTFTVPASDALANFTSLSWQVTATNACSPPTLSACSPFQTQSCAPTQDLVTNGGFEQGLTGWSSDAVIPPPVVTTAEPHSGAYSVQLGEIGYFGIEPFGDSAISQILTVPPGVSPTLSFWEWPESPAFAYYDQQYALVTPVVPAGPSVTLLSEVNNAQTYLQRQFPLAQFAGQTVRLTFGVHENGEFFYGTGMYIDDVSAAFTRCGPPDFTLQMTPVSGTEVCAGNSIPYTVSVSSLNGPNFTSPVTLSAAGLPPGTSATFATNPVAPGQSTTVTLQTTRPTIGQVYGFTVTGAAVTPPPSGAHAVSANVTIDANAPDVPQILSPSNGQVNVSMVPTLSWTAPFVPDGPVAASTTAGGPQFFGAPQYHLQVALDSAFANVVIDTNLAATMFTPASSLSMATQYFWRVSGTNLCGTSPWSSVSSFIVGACTEGWTTLASIPISTLENASAVAVPEVGKIYFIGGGTGYYGESYNQTWAYDPASDGWSQKSDVPSPGVGATYGSAVELGGTIYVFGGYSDYTFLNTLWMYNVATDTWAQGANLPTPNYGSAVAVIDGEIYLAYGTGFGTQTWQYDPVANTYTQKSSAPSLVSNTNLHGVALGGSLHAFAGANQGTSHVVYTPATDTWTTAPSLPFGVTDPAVGVIGGKAYVVGGSSNGQTQIFDPDTNAWTQSAALPGTAGGLGSTQGAVLGVHMHVVGGYGTNGVVSTHWQFHPCSAGALSSAAFLPLVVDGNGRVSDVTNEGTSILIDNSVSGTSLTATCFLYAPSGSVLGRASFSLAAGELYTATDVVRTLVGATTVQNLNGSVAIFGTDLFQATASLVHNGTGDSAFESSQPIAGTLSGVLPAIEEGTDVTQVVFSNVSTNTAILELVAYPAAGGEIPAAATLAFLAPNSTVNYANVVEQLNLPNGFLGELTFSSNQPVAAVARAVVPRRGYSGFEPVRGSGDPASAVYVPYVEDTTAFNTTLLLNNPTVFPADLTVTLVDTEDSTGATAGAATSRDVPLPVNAAMSIPNVVRWVLSSTATTPTGKHGFLVVTTPQAVTAQAKIVDAVTSDPSIPQNETSLTSAFSPLLIKVEPISFALTAETQPASVAGEAAAASASETTLSRFALSNPGSASATVELAAVNASGGTPTAPFTVTLAPNGQLFTEDLAGTMGLPPVFFGWLTVQSNTPVLVYNQRRSGDTGDSVPVCTE